MSKLPGPIEIEVIRNALTAAAAEMDVTVWRTSRSTIVRELLDYSTAVFDAEGNNLAQSARIPSHLNSMSHFLRELLDKYIDPDDLGAGRRRHLQRPLLRRPAPAGHLRLQAGLPRGTAHRLRRHALPPHRCRRPGRRQLCRQGDRDLPGRPAHPAVEADRERRPQRGRLGDDPAEHQEARLAAGRPAEPDRFASRSAPRRCGGWRRAMVRTACSRPASASST